MSVGKKIVDGARAGLGSLLDKIRADEAPLQGARAAELERELAARKALRARRGERKPEDNPRARDAGGGPAAARRRAEAAEARAKKAGASDKARRAAEQTAGATAAGAAASEDTFRRFRDDVKSGRGPAPGPTAGASSSAGPRRPFFGSSDKVAKAYKALDLADGAGWDEIRTRYRKLMRKYHPDMHAGDDRKQKAATELSMQITQAYNLLDEHFHKKGS